MLPPDSTLIRCNTLYLACKTCKKGQRISHSLSFSVGANCVRPRAFTERPYEDDFLSVGKTCFMEGTAYESSFYFYKQKFIRLYSEETVKTFLPSFNSSPLKYARIPEGISTVYVKIPFSYRHSADILPRTVKVLPFA